MGGVHSGAHNLGEALWVQERQRQKSHRESARFESQSAESTQDRRKLLKRTRSLAVISEDESRLDREGRRYGYGDTCSTFDLPRRHQLIPRAKLIDRNSLKDRLCKSQQHLSDSYERFNELRSYQSRSTCGLHSIPTASSFAEQSIYATGCPRPTTDPDRLNILDWPKPARRYRSVQTLDTVTDLVDIVEDGWPIEGNRSIDCIYTQVKRKRKEHRSLDSILFEDDGELEYFDVLNLLPLSNVRLEFDEEDARNGDLDRPGRIIDLSEESKPRSSVQRDSSVSSSSNATDEEKCKGGSKEGSGSHQDSQDSQDRSKDLDSSRGSSARNSPEVRVVQEESDVDVRAAAADRFRTEQTEDTKSIWISDTDELEEMSRRPQVLKIVDSDVTKRRHRHSNLELEPGEEAAKDQKPRNEATECPSDNLKMSPTKNSQDAKESKVEESGQKSVSIFERERPEKEGHRGGQAEGRFERIVKETSSILGKACNAVKGSLGFEARSESSDLGLGSESGSESTRRRSVDDDGIPTSTSSEPKNSHGGLTRSKSCVDSIQCQQEEHDHQQEGEPEFDHVRYKIIKSHVFSKNMFSGGGGGGGKGDVTYEGLMQYLREYSFQELLLDNNVVIIEPVRAETIERKSSPSGKTRSESGKTGASQTRNKSGNELEDRTEERLDGGTVKSPKQSSIRKHFFYHPIRVNRELIDEELPDPDTVRNVRRMFENTLKTKNGGFSFDCKNGKSVSMKDLTSTEDNRGEEMEKAREESRSSRCSSRAKDLTRLFENMEKSSTTASAVHGAKDEPDSPRTESKTRILAQSFEARSGHTSPSDSTSSKNKLDRYHHHHHHHHNWDSGSVSSGVSSDYPDTDAGSGAQCTSSEDEEADCQEDEGNDTRAPGHYVSQDVLKKIRECGTSVTYYGGKVVNTCNGPLILPLTGNRFKRANHSSNDYVKFRLVKSNSCDSRLELTGRVLDEPPRRTPDRSSDLSRYAIAETPSIEIATLENPVEEEHEQQEEGGREDSLNGAEVKREPPVVIGLEPKREEAREPKSFKADFRLGCLEDARSNYPSRFVPSALTRWQINEANWKTGEEFGKMEFEEFEVLEDSLNGTERLEAAS